MGTRYRVCGAEIGDGIERIDRPGAHRTSRAHNREGPVPGLPVGSHRRFEGRDIHVKFAVRRDDSHVLAPHPQQLRSLDDGGVGFR